jgi:transposase-like protein
MPRMCTVCAHSERASIEAALVSGAAYRDIARQHHVSKDALMRHKADHIPAAIAKSQEAKEEAQALDVVRQLKAINGTAIAILADARRRRDDDTALRAMDRIHKQLELQAKLLGELSEAPTVNVILTPEWVTFRTTLVAALAPFPEARAAASAALLAAERRAS